MQLDRESRLETSNPLQMHRPLTPQLTDEPLCYGDAELRITADNQLARLLRMASNHNHASEGTAQCSETKHCKMMANAGSA